MKYDVAIIGGGPAGYTAAERAAQGGLSTILFEKNALGGVCLNEGCVPTKTLLYSAKTYDNIKHASKYAVKAENPSFDLYGIGNGNSSYTRIGGDGILDEPGGVAIEGASGLFGDNRWRRDRYGVRFFLQ